MLQNDLPLILAIDLGTSGPKVALVTPYGRVLDCAIGETRLILYGHDGAEQDPDDWWRAIAVASQELLARRPHERRRLAAICCTSQWSGTVPVDRQGRHLMNAIIWMDNRGAPYVRQVTGGPIRIAGFGLDKLAAWIRRTGGIPGHSGKDPIAHILYLKHERPDIYAATYKFLEPKDYLNLRLTGLYAASYESITLHWVTDNRRINAVAYDDRLLQLGQLERHKLPDLQPAVAVLGPILPEAAADLGVPPDLPVIMGTPDVHSAAIGSGAVADYAAHLYIGTSSWLACHVPFKKTDLLHNIASLPSAIPGRYMVINEQETAGACLAHLKNNILFPEDELSSATGPRGSYKAFDNMAVRIPPGSEGVIYTPWLNGERTPVDDHAVRGGFHNLSLQHHRGHLIRAVMEGVAYNSRWLLGYVENFVRRRFDAIHLIGGGANSAVWCQIQADVLNRPIVQIKDPVEANARGAGILAGVALGLVTFDQAAAQVEIAHTYTPDPRHRALYDAQYATFRRIYQYHRRIFA